MLLAGILRIQRDSR